LIVNNVHSNIFYIFIYELIYKVS